MKVQNYRLPSLIGLLFFLFLTYSSSAVSADVIHLADFENGTFGDLVNANGCCSYSHAVSSTQARDGSYSIRFQSSSNDPVSGNTPGKTMLGWNSTGGVGTERWYSFSVFFDSTWKDHTKDPNGTIIYQWHRVNDACDTFTGQNLAFRVLPNENLVVVNSSDSTQCNTNSTVAKAQWNLGAISKGSWTDFVVYAKWSFQSDGILRVWKNGVEVIERVGPNFVNDSSSPFIRFGIYKSWWNREQPSPADKLIAYFDDVRIANANSSYEDVASTKSQSSTPPAPTNLQVVTP
jgi:hypothetical protein